MAGIGTELFRALLLSVAVFRVVPQLTERLELAIPTIPALPALPVKPDENGFYSLRTQSTRTQERQNRRLTAFSDITFLWFYPQ